MRRASTRHNPLFYCCQRSPSLPSETLLPRWSASGCHPLSLLAWNDWRSRRQGWLFCLSRLFCAVPPYISNSVRKWLASRLTQPESTIQLDHSSWILSWAAQLLSRPRFWQSLRSHEARIFWWDSHPSSSRMSQRFCAITSSRSQFYRLVVSTGFDKALTYQRECPLP